MQIKDDKDNNNKNRGSDIDKDDDDDEPELEQGAEAGLKALSEAICDFIRSAANHDAYRSRQRQQHGQCEPGMRTGMKRKLHAI